MGDVPTWAGNSLIIFTSRNDQEKPENKGADVRPHPCFRGFFHSREALIM
jgi:hypothetical protein